MQIGDLIKPKMHLEALREPHREDHGLLEVHTRWEDPKTVSYTHLTLPTKRIV